MDQTSNNASAAAAASAAGRRAASGPVLDSHPSLRKRASHAGMRSASHGQPLSSAGQSIAVMPRDGFSSRGFGDGAKARKGSIRNAVRKIFGRRGRDVVSTYGSPDPVVHPPTARHAYHKSEPLTSSPREDIEPSGPIETDSTNIVERSIPNDLYLAPRSPTLGRTGSPYAVQFPNSVRLKPMDLGNPFIAPPNQLRRRKTLPSLVLNEATGQMEPRLSTDVPHEPARDTLVQGSDNEQTLTQIKKSRRKSRSTDDLKRLSMAHAHETASPRKKSEEIRHLRESFQPDVLRASGFTTRLRAKEEEDEQVLPGSSHSQHKSFREHEDNEDKFRIPLPSDGQRAVSARGSPSVHRTPGHKASPSAGTGAGAGDQANASPGAGSEASKDLEDRVAKLEAGLQDFQLSLQRLTAERNRRTIVMGTVTTRRSSSDMRSPSLLAETLAEPLEPSSYEYEYGHTLRPSTSPQPLAQSQTQLPVQPPAQHPQLDDPFSPDPPPKRQPSTASRNPETLAMPTPAPTVSSRTTPTQPYTFSSLYQMLSDERSARRNLESQLKSLQRDIADLHTQVAVVGSGAANSHRSSYMLAGSSSRLQELLRETGEDNDGATTGTALPRSLLVSRFSGSESDAVLQRDDDATTVYTEDYRTPREERSMYSLVGSRRGEEEEGVDSGKDEMF